MPRLYLDTETYNETVDLRDVGAHIYAKSAEILIITWALADGPVHIVDLGKGPATGALKDFEDALNDENNTVIAHNAQFDRLILNQTWGTDPRRWRCTMARAYSAGLPGSLEQLGAVLGIDKDKAKIADGKKLIRRFCVPNPQNQKLRRCTAYTHPEEWERFCEYAINDIHALREIDQKLPNWNFSAEELALWHLDQEMNDRGFLVDEELVAAAIDLGDRDKQKQLNRFRRMTGGMVESPLQRGRFLQFINDTFNVGLEDTRKETLAELFKAPGTDAGLKNIIEQTARLSKTSTAKYASLKQITGDDGRARGTLQYAGASRTRRWAGRKFQPQNLPSRGVPEQDENDLFIRAARNGVADLLFDKHAWRLSGAIRGCIVAPPGKALFVADLSNIEGRLNAWFAGEKWKLQAFRDYDAGEGHDLYLITAARILGTTPAELLQLPKAEWKAHRNGIGKVAELAGGYAGGFGAYQNFAKGKMAALWPSLQKELPKITVAKVKENWRTWGRERSPDANETEWFATEAVKVSWRERNSQIVKSWRSYEDAAINAVENPGQVYIHHINENCSLVFKTRMKAGHRYLTVKMPSGRSLSYFDPKIKDGTLTYMGINGVTRQWVRETSYGGKLCIAKGALVVTDRGPVPIEQVERTDLVWDGDTFVRHGGLIKKGVQNTIECFGVRMTPDHEVLTTKGWREAKHAQKGFNRKSCRLPDGCSSRRKQRQKVTLETEVHLRERGCPEQLGHKESNRREQTVLLRMPKKAVHRTSKPKTRFEQIQWLRRLAVYEMPLPKQNTPSLQELWRAWGRLCGPLARFRRILAGYGSVLPFGFNLGAGRQQQGVLAGELYLGELDRPSCEQKDDEFRRDCRGADVSLRSRAEIRTEQVDSTLPIRPGRYTRRGNRACREVFDLQNCGPRRRYVVLDKFGDPVIVHNCENLCQSFARDILAEMMIEAEKRGFKIVLTVHDEIVAEADEGRDLQDLIDVLSTNLPWTEGLPLAADGFKAKRYRK